MLVACGLALVAWALAFLHVVPGADLQRYVALTIAAWVCFVAAARTVIALDTRPGRWDFVLIFAIAILMRLPLLSISPSLSDDGYRAVWDARLMHAGLNPYASAPNDPALAPYRDAVIWPRVNHPDQRTPYPPLAELLSAAAYAVLPERLIAIQGLAACADLVSAALLAIVLARFGMDPRRCVVIAWSPMGAVHFAHSGHNDAVMIAFVLAATLLLTGRRRVAAMGALGLATMVKATPAFLVPAFVRSAGGRATLAWAGVCALLTLPLIGAGPGLVLGVLREAGDEQFNDSLHLIVQRIAAMVAPSGASALASAIGLVVVAGAAAAAWWWGDGSARGALTGGSRVLAAYVLVAPVVEPWYFTWLAPLVALELRPATGRGWLQINDALAWLWLMGAGTLTEVAYLPGGTGWWPAVRAVEYVPALLFLSIGGWRWWRRRRASRP